MASLYYLDIMVNFNYIVNANLTTPTTPGASPLLDILYPRDIGLIIPIPNDQPDNQPDNLKPIISEIFFSFQHLKKV